MNEQKKREAFEAAMWEDALSEGAEPNLTRGPNGDYVQPWISGAWHGYQTASAATQRDAMAVAEAVRDACANAARWHGHHEGCNNVDLTAIVEAVRPIVKLDGDTEAGKWARVWNATLVKCAHMLGMGAGASLTDVPEVLRERLAAPPTSTQQQGEPVAWVRFCSDGCYEGPIMNSAMEGVRKKSGAWTPLYTDPAAPACSVPDGWRDIESAPKDGRTILLGYFNALGNWRTLRGQWFTKEHIDDEWEDADIFDAGWYETSVEADDVPSCWPTDPTHWMPTPAAPKPEGGGA